MCYDIGMAETCHAQTRLRFTHYGSPHTVTCKREMGHDGMHEWSDDAARTVYWQGDSKPPDNTRFRFGKWLEDRS